MEGGFLSENRWHVTVGQILENLTEVLMSDTETEVVSAEKDQKIIYTGPSPRGWHRLQQAAECLQKYAWSYEAPKTEGSGSKSQALARGSLIHLALAQHYARMRAAQKDPLVKLGEQDEDAPELWCDPEEAVRLIARLEKTESHLDNVLTTYKAYNRYYDFEGEMQTMKILAVEDLLSATIGGKYLFTGRMDLVYEDLGGRIWVLDHKTTARLTASHKEYYSISGQLLGYGFLARQKYGDRFAGIKVNLIQHGDSPKFERITLPRAPNLESKFERIVMDIEESVERMQASGREFDNWPKAINEMTCHGRYGACAFIDQCRNGYGAKKAGNWTWKDL